MYLAIDPGAHPGWAVLAPTDMELVACGIGRFEGRIVKGWPTQVLCERPTIYPKSPVPPNDIGTLCISAGKLVWPFEERGAEILWVEPRTWKGQVPKRIHHARIRKELTEVELTRVNACLKDVAERWCEDAMDAVGLALYGRKMRLFR